MEQGEFLRTQRIMRLATVSEDGTPHVVPVWYMYDGKRFHVGTNARTRKARNVGRLGRAAFCIDEGVNSPIRGVMAECRASLVRGSAVRGTAEGIISRYLDVRGGQAAELLRDTDCIIELVPENVTEWRY